MNTLMVLKHIEKRVVIPHYFKNEDEAVYWWSHLPSSDEWEIIYLEERKPCGHRYELMYAKFDQQGYFYSKYIICFSKKETIILARKIKEANSNYIINIKKLY